MISNEDVEKVAKMLRDKPDSDGYEVLAEVVGKERCQSLLGKLARLMEEQDLFKCDSCNLWCDVSVSDWNYDSTCNSCSD